MRILLIDVDTVVGTIRGSTLKEVSANNPNLIVIEDTFGIEKIIGMKLINGVLSGEPYPTPEAPSRVPSSVTMRQARLVLLERNLLVTVNDSIKAMEGPVGEKARIEWEFATRVIRDSELVSIISAILDLNNEQLDDLFITANKL